jgi:LacI family transcriptional regulator
VGGILFDSLLVVDGDFRYSGGQEAMRKLLEVSERPEAVFAANDLMAIGAMEVARNAGLSIPRDIAVVGYDDIPLAPHTSPPLTTMAIPKQELGRAAAQVVLEHLKNVGKARAVRRIFAADLVVRSSASYRLGRFVESIN